MAAPTSVRVESNSITTATIRWSYSGASRIAVYRSTNGISYSEVTTENTRVDVGTTSYIDTTLSAGTKYWYKLTDDVGSTFSSVVTVYAQSCLPAAGSGDTFSLPRLEHGTPDPSDEFNNLAERIESVLGGRVLSPFECIACPTDGALVLNCAGHCREFVVIADEDINSISVQYCDEGDGNIDFIVPPSATRRIDGWPNGFGFSGDEGFQAPISGGSNGRTVSVPTGKTGGKGKPTSSKPGTGSGIGAGGGRAAGTCNCTPTLGNLTIKSCNANNSLLCASTRSLQLIACGGRPPYTWTNTGTVTLSKSTGPNTTVTPPTNSGSATAGVAYVLFKKMTITNAGSCENWIARLEFSCADVAGTCATAADPGTLPEVCNGDDITTINQLSCYNCDGSATPCTGSHQCTGDFGCNAAACATIAAGGLLCDKRTAPMIAAGCVPCGLNAGSTVTVTDSVGTQATIILRE